MYQTRKVKVAKQGFTIVELMIAMSFVAVLLLAIAAMAIQMSVIYNRGITLREVNQAGRYVIDSMSRDIAAASNTFDVETSYIETSGGSRLCLGDATYAWSTKELLEADAESGTDSALTKYENGEPVRFVRIEDAGARYCKYGEDGQIESTPIESDQATELLSDGQRDLVVRGFKIEQAPSYSQDYSAARLYIVKVVIGTNDSDYISTSGDNRCQPSDDQTDRSQSYCAINEFKFVARAGNLR